MGKKTESSGGEWQSAVPPRKQRQRDRKKQQLAEDKKARALVLNQQKVKKEQDLLAQQQAQSELAKTKAFSIEFNAKGVPLAQQPTLKKSRRTNTRKTKKSDKGQKSDQENVVNHALLNVDEVKTLLTDIGEKYKDQYEVQLRYLGEYFEAGFSAVRAFEYDDLLGEFDELEEEFDRPLIHVPKPVWAVVNAWLSRVPRQPLSNYFWATLDQVSPLSKEDKFLLGKGNGLRALLQIIVKRTPALFKDKEGESSMKKYAVDAKKSHLLATIQEISPIKLMLHPATHTLFVWLFAQLRDRYPMLSLILWFKYLLPILCFNSTTDTMRNLLINYAYVLLDNDEALCESKPGDINIPIIALERLTVLNFSLKRESSEFQKRIEELYADMIEYTIFFNKSTPSHYFLMLLGHAAVIKEDEREENLRDDVCALLIRALEDDHHCFARWLEIYPRFIPQSNNLLLFLSLNWDTYKSRISNSALCKQARAFISINKQILAGSYVIKLPKDAPQVELKLNKQNIRVCSVTCQALIKRIERSFASILLYLFIFSIALLFAFLYSCTFNGCQHDWCSKLIQCSPRSM